MSITFLSLGFDIITEIAIRIDDLTSYVAWLNTCSMTRRVDGVIHGIKRKQLYITVRKKKTRKRVMRVGEIHKIKFRAKVVYDKEKGKKNVKHGRYMVTTEYEGSKTEADRFTYSGGYYHDGVMVGTWFEFGSRICGLREFVDDKLHGYMRVYDIRDLHGNYRRMPLSDEAWEMFHKAGIKDVIPRVNYLKSEAVYIEGKKISSVEYNFGGKVISDGVYEDGNYVGKYVYPGGVKTYVPRGQKIELSGTMKEDIESYKIVVENK